MNFPRLVSCDDQPPRSLARDEEYVRPCSSASSMVLVEPQFGDREPSVRPSSQSQSFVEALPMRIRTCKVASSRGMRINGSGSLLWKASVMSVG